MPTTSIGLDDNFFALGGDSVTAMQLIAVARASGVLLSVAEVFQFPRLHDMARVIKTVQTFQGQEPQVMPFTLLPDSIDVSICTEEVAELCKVDVAMVADMYPATPIQEALLVVSTYRRWAYTHQSIFEMSPSMDINRFKVAWESVVAEQPILRPRVVNTHEVGTLQVILHSKLQWNYSSFLEQYLEEDRERPMTYGTELSRWAIISGEKSYFVWTIHHSMYDGWSLSMIFDEVKRMYQTGTTNKTIPYGRFVQYLTNLEKQQSDDFWRRQFPGYTDMYPSLPTFDYKPVAQSMKSSLISIPEKRHINVTIPSLVKAAWALLMSKYTGESKALFGLTLSGRDAPVDDITEILGPTLTTVPLRVPIDEFLSVANFLQKVQEQVTNIRRHQHTELQHIRRLGREASAAVEFQDLLVIQNVGDEEIRSSLSGLGLEQIHREAKDFFNLALTLECIVRHESIQMNLRYDENVIGHLQSQHLLHQLGHTILTLMAEENQHVTLSEIDLVSDEELQQLSTWIDETDNDLTGMWDGPSRYRSLVVDAGDTGRFVPIGCLGELLIEVLPGSNPQLPMRTENEIPLIDLAWLRSSSQSSGQTQRTNHLVRRHADGDLSKLGPIDGQVKIRGRRVELKTIATLLHENLPPDNEVLVDGWQTELNPSEKSIIAFVSLIDFKRLDETSTGDSIYDQKSVLQRLLPELEGALVDKMPDYLVPTLYAPISSFPITSAGRFDKKALKEYAKALPSNFMCSRDLNSRKQRPTNEMERSLQTIWSRILGHPDVGIHDTFTSLGGDLIHAMQIVTACRKNNISISVSAILSQKKIVTLAPLCTYDAKNGKTSYSRLRQICDNLEEHVQQVLSELEVDIENVEASFPCTAMQEGILLSQQKGRDIYRVSSGWEILQNATTKNLDFNRIVKAWQSLIGRHSAMRTGIIEDTKDPGHFVQVVLKRIPTRIVESQIVLSALAEAADILPPVEHSFWSHLPYLTVFRLSTGAFVSRLDIGHTMVDAASMDILISEFVDVLVGKQPNNPKSDYGEFVQYEKSLPQEATLSYWTRRLNDTRTCHLPSQYQDRISTDKYRFYAVAKSVSNKINDFCKRKSIIPAALIQTAWSILLGAFVNRNDVCFGYLASDRDAPIDGIESHIGLYISMQICHVSLQGLVKDLLYHLQDSIIEGFKYRHCSLAAIQNALGLREEPLFNTCVTVVRAVPQEIASRAASAVRMLDLPQKSEYVISVNASVGQSDVDITFSYQSDCISEKFVESIGGSLEAILDSMVNDADQLVNDVDLLSPNDFHMLQSWNPEVPHVDVTVQELIDRQVIATPDAVAISSFEGQWSYLELDETASSLAMYLLDINLDLGPEIPVMLCFKKSVWAIISRLAVFKTGSYFVPIHPDDPTPRLIDLCTTTGSKIVLCDGENYHRFSSNLRTIVVDPSLLERYAMENDTDNQRQTESFSYHQSTDASKVKPDNAAMMLFTSGSTGKPKGVILQHRALASALTIHTEGLSIDSNSRVLQFVAYTFDVSIIEIFGPLIRGGCVCVISEDIRMNHLTQTINEQSATWCFMTPSVLKLLSPSNTPSLKTVTYGGENGTKQMIQDWCNHVTLVDVYGPTAASIFSTYNFNDSTSDPENIGHAAGCNIWITQLENPDRLLPIGCVGELLIEGPGLARGYLDNVQADKAFITSPKWSQGGKPRCFYRTGDLARYNTNGSITFLGRADAQIKITGRRVELSEIEYQIQKCLQSTTEVIAEVVRYRESSEPSLTAFIKTKPAEVRTGVLPAVSTNNIGFVTLRSKPGSILARNKMNEIQSMLPTLTRRLSEVLPQYMIPSIYIPVISIPRTTSGKTDRARLRSFAQLLNQDEMCIPGINVDKCQPENETETILQSTLAEILDVPHQTIGIDDAFTSIGGDSIIAIRTVSKCRQVDINVSVAHIFKHKTIRNIARVVRQDLETPKGPHLQLEPHSREHAQREILCSDLAGLLADPSITSKVSEDNVQEILPLAPFQKVSVEGNMDNPPKHWTFLFIDLPITAETERVKTSCEALMCQFDILRTIFVKAKNEDLVQIFLETHEASFTILETRDDISATAEVLCREDLGRDRNLGESFVAFILIRAPFARRLIIRLSHAQFDGFNCSTLVQTYSALYEGVSVPRIPSYSKFIRHTIERNYESYDYWRLLLEGSEITTVPQITQQNPGFTDPSVVRVNREVSQIGLLSGVTSATVFTAACSLLLSSLTGSNDVVFGRLVSGRTSLPEDLASTVGPCLNIVPMRTQFYPNQSMNDLLAAVQLQTMNSSVHETVGLSEISQHCLSSSTTRTSLCPLDATGKPYFPVISQYTNIDAAPKSDHSNQQFRLSVWDSTLVHPFPQSLCLSGTPNENGVIISVSADAEWCKSEDMAIICDELCHILERIAKEAIRQ